MRIALDAMGGDLGPRPAVEGAIGAVRQYGMEVVLVGKARHLNKFMARMKVHDSRIHIVDAPDRVTMHESPKDSLRKRKSSLAIACDLVRQGDCDALVSAGNTGAVNAHTLTKWRTLPGIKKPAIATMRPTIHEPVIVIDAGANVDCKPRQLLQFAVMGNVYAREVLHRPNPRVGLLNIGEEECKGNELTLATYTLLRNSHLNFVGNAEGRDLFTGDFDVVVCDGFAGNVVLKCAEGCAGMVGRFIKRESRKSLLTLMGLVAMSPVFRRLRRAVDPEEVGGAPLLGLNGICIICHGAANKKAFKNALRQARQAVTQQINAHIIDELQHIQPVVESAQGTPAPQPVDMAPEPVPMDTAPGPDSQANTTHSDEQVC